MKKFIYITVVFMFMLIFIGCVTPEQRKELSDSRGSYNLTEGVGNKPFVGSPNNPAARDQFTVLTW